MTVTTPRTRAAAWANWGRTQSAHPLRVERPGSAEELAECVSAAAREGLTVRAVGSGHSFSPVAVTDGVQLSLDGLTGLLGVDADRRSATFAAGTEMHCVGPLLAQHGLALANMGDIDRQTLAGAFSTGTHGTGLGLTGLPGQLRGVRLVTASGEEIGVSASENAHLWPAVRLGLGALGVLTEMTIQCVPEFVLSASERRESLDRVLEEFEGRCRASDHFEFFWFPHTDAALTKTNTRLPREADARPLGQLREWFDDSFLANRVFGAACRLGSALPSVIPPVNRLSAALLGAREFSGASYDVFVSERTVRFAEMEYAVELARVPEIMREIRALIERRGWRISFPVEVRSAAADEGVWLSTAGGRESGYIAVHQYHRSDPGEYFRGVEEIFRAHGGRPHWGKMHTADVEYLKTVYPHLGDFARVRAEMDPLGVFLNDHVRGLLGAAPSGNARGPRSVSGALGEAGSGGR